MRLVSYHPAGLDQHTSFGLLDSRDQIVDLKAASRTGARTLRQWLALGGLKDLAEFENVKGDISLDDVRLLPVIPDPAHVWCLAINYQDHIAEIKAAGINRDTPQKPAVFMRYPDTLVGHNGPLVLPKVSAALDWEAELAVVIGKEGRYVMPERALDHVAGYTCFNDGSIRDWQFHTRQITPGKNFFSTGALGPWLVTADAIRDPHALRIITRLNGQVMQDGTTADMLFRIPQIIAYVSSLLPLQPGDVIATGTPSGVGFSRKPPIYMQAGDVCDVEIEGIGRLINRVQAE